MPRLSREYERIFAEMMEEVHRSHQGGRRLTAFWPQVSAGFVPGKDWLYVGQAVFGWGSSTGDEPPAFGRGRPPRITGTRRYSEVKKKVKSCQLRWTEERRGKASPFWSTVRWLNSDDDPTWVEGWSRRMAWSNLYKIAPQGRRNPDPALRSVQREKCQRLLDLEIRELRPAAVVVLAGVDWYRDFRWGPTADFKRALNDPARTVLRATVHGVPAALAPHPNTAFHAGLRLEALGGKIMAALGWEKRGEKWIRHVSRRH